MEEIQNKNKIDNDDPLDPIWKEIQKDFVLKKYVLKENIREQLVPQSKLIYANVKDGDDFSKIFYSYITFHQIHFHLKNYILSTKKKFNGYKREFIDIFQDIFVDNFLIFKELSKYLKEDYFHYMNLWLDGFFLSLFRKYVGEQKIKKQRIQPELFFAVILFLALPKISKYFNDVPFTSIIQFQEATQKDWEEALDIIDKLDLKEYLNSDCNKVIRDFLLIFMDLNVLINDDGNFYFDDEGTVKCLDFMDILSKKTNEMIANIKKIRKNLFKE